MNRSRASARGGIAVRAPAGRDTTQVHGYPSAIAHEVLRKLDVPTKHPYPSHELLTKLVEAVFFAGLLTEEAAPVGVSIVFSRSGLADLRARAGWLVFEFAAVNALPDRLAKLSNTGRVGVAPIIITESDGELTAVGIAKRPLVRKIRPETDEEPLFCISSFRPGSIVVEHGDRELVASINGVIQPDFPELLWASAPGVAAVVKLRRRILPNDDGVIADDLVYRAIRAISLTRHGGMIVVPADDEDAERLKRIPGSRLNEPLPIASAFRLVERMDNVVHDAQTALIEVDKKTGTLIGHRLPPSDQRIEAFTRTRDFLDENLAQLARFSSLDGALLATPDFDIAAFGVHISVKDCLRRVYRATTDPPRKWPRFDLSRTGTRHRAAASIVAADHRRLAFIASHDGPIACFCFHQEKLVYWPLRTLASWIVL